MEIKKTKIIDKAVQIIVNSGLEALTIQNLSSELGINKNKLFTRFNNDDEILLILLLSFEAELKEIVHESSIKFETPETKLKLLFKRLYFLFLKKPHYLSIIFDKSLFEREDYIKTEIIEIKNIAEKYLTTIINTGKLSHDFKTKVSTKLIVRTLLSEFRLLMKDEQRFNEMILELKTFKD